MSIDKLRHGYDDITPHTESFYILITKRLFQYILRSITSNSAVPTVASVNRSGDLQYDQDSLKDAFSPLNLKGLEVMHTLQGIPNSILNSYSQSNPDTLYDGLHLDSARNPISSPILQEELVPIPFHLYSQLLCLFPRSTLLFCPLTVKSPRIRHHPPYEYLWGLASVTYWPYLHDSMIIPPSPSSSSSSFQQPLHYEQRPPETLAITISSARQFYQTQQGVKCLLTTYLSNLASILHQSSSPHIDPTIVLLELEDYIGLTTTLIRLIPESIIPFPIVFNLPPSETLSQVNSAYKHLCAVYILIELCVFMRTVSHQLGGDEGQSSQLTDDSIDAVHQLLCSHNPQFPTLNALPSSYTLLLIRSVPLVGLTRLLCDPMYISSAIALYYASCGASILPYLQHYQQIYHTVVLPDSGTWTIPDFLQLRAIQQSYLDQNNGQYPPSMTSNAVFYALDESIWSAFNEAEDDTHSLSLPQDTTTGDGQSENNTNNTDIKLDIQENDDHGNNHYDDELDTLQQSTDRLEFHKINQYTLDNSTIYDISGYVFNTFDYLSKHPQYFHSLLSQTTSAYVHPGQSLSPVVPLQDKLHNRHHTDDNITDNDDDNGDNDNDDDDSPYNALRSPMKPCSVHLMAYPTQQQYLISTPPATGTTDHSTHDIVESYHRGGGIFYQLHDGRYDALRHGDSSDDDGDSDSSSGHFKGDTDSNQSLEGITGTISFLSSVKQEEISPPLLPPTLFKPWQRQTHSTNGNENGRFQSNTRRNHSSGDMDTIDYPVFHIVFHDVYTLDQLQSFAAPPHLTQQTANTTCLTSLPFFSQTLVHQLASHTIQLSPSLERFAYPCQSTTTPLMLPRQTIDILQTSQFSSLAYPGFGNARRYTAKLQEFFTSDLLNPHPPFSLSTGGVRGLQNLGNTCFMNSILQCLNTVRPFLDLMLDPLGLVQLINPKSEYGGNIVRSLLAVFGMFWRQDSPRVFPPVPAKLALELMNSDFKGGHQHDSQEALITFINGLIDDTNHSKYPHLLPFDDIITGYSQNRQSVISDSQTPQPFTTHPSSFFKSSNAAYQLNLRKSADEYFIQQLSFNRSVFMPLFQTITTQEMACTGCGRLTYGHDTTSTFRVVIPPRAIAKPVGIQFYHSISQTWHDIIRFNVEGYIDDSYELFSDILPSSKTATHLSNHQQYYPTKGSGADISNNTNNNHNHIILDDRKPSSSQPNLATMYSSAKTGGGYESITAPRPTPHQIISQAEPSVCAMITQSSSPEELIDFCQQVIFGDTPSTRTRIHKDDLFLYRGRDIDLIVYLPSANTPLIPSSSLIESDDELLSTPPSQRSGVSQNSGGKAGSARPSTMFIDMLPDKHEVKHLQILPTHEKTDEQVLNEFYDIEPPTHDTNQPQGLFSSQTKTEMAATTVLSIQSSPHAESFLPSSVIIPMQLCPYYTYEQHQYRSPTVTTDYNPTESTGGPTYSRSTSWSTHNSSENRSTPPGASMPYNSTFQSSLGSGVATTPASPLPQRAGDPPAGTPDCLDFIPSKMHYDDNVLQTYGIHTMFIRIPLTRKDIEEYSRVYIEPFDDGSFNFMKNIVLPYKRSTRDDPQPHPQPVNSGNEAQDNMHTFALNTDDNGLEPMTNSYGGNDGDSDDGNDDHGGEHLTVCTSATVSKAPLSALGISICTEDTRDTRGNNSDDTRFFIEYSQNNDNNSNGHPHNTSQPVNLRLSGSSGPTMNINGSPYNQVQFINQQPFDESRINFTQYNHQSDGLTPVTSSRASSAADDYVSYPMSMQPLSPHAILHNIDSRKTQQRHHLQSTNGTSSPLYTGVLPHDNDITHHHTMGTAAGHSLIQGISDLTLDLPSTTQKGSRDHKRDATHVIFHDVPSPTSKRQSFSNHTPIDPAANQYNDRYQSGRTTTPTPFCHEKASNNHVQVSSCASSRHIYHKTSPQLSSESDDIQIDSIESGGSSRMQLHQPTTTTSSSGYQVSSTMTSAKQSSDDDDPITVGTSTTSAIEVSSTLYGGSVATYSHRFSHLSQSPRSNKNKSNDDYAADSSHPYQHQLTSSQDSNDSSQPHSDDQQHPSSTAALLGSTYNGYQFKWTPPEKYEHIAFTYSIDSTVLAHCIAQALIPLFDFSLLMDRGIDFFNEAHYQQVFLPKYGQMCKDLFHLITEVQLRQHYLIMRFAMYFTEAISLYIALHRNHDHILSLATLSEIGFNPDSVFQILFPAFLFDHNPLQLHMHLSNDPTTMDSNNSNEHGESVYTPPSPSIQSPPHVTPNIYNTIHPHHQYHHDVISGTNLHHSQHYPSNQEHHQHVHGSHESIPPPALSQQLLPSTRVNVPPTPLSAHDDIFTMNQYEISSTTAESEGHGVRPFSTVDSSEMKSSTSHNGNPHSIGMPMNREDVGFHSRGDDVFPPRDGSDHSGDTNESDSDHRGLHTLPILEIQQSEHSLSSEIPTQFEMDDDEDDDLDDDESDDDYQDDNENDDLNQSIVDDDTMELDEVSHSHPHKHQHRYLSNVISGYSSDSKAQMQSNMFNSAPLRHHSHHVEFDTHHAPTQRQWQVTRNSTYPMQPRGDEDGSHQSPSFPLSHHFVSTPLMTQGQPTDTPEVSDYIEEGISPCADGDGDHDGETPLTQIPIIQSKQGTPPHHQHQHHHHHHHYQQHHHRNHHQSSSFDRLSHLAGHSLRQSPHTARQSNTPPSHEATRLLSPSSQRIIKSREKRYHLLKNYDHISPSQTARYLQPKYDGNGDRGDDPQDQKKGKYHYPSQPHLQSDQHKIHHTRMPSFTLNAHLLTPVIHHRALTSSVALERLYATIINEYKCLTIQDVRANERHSQRNEILRNYSLYTEFDVMTNWDKVSDAPTTLEDCVKAVLVPSYFDAKCTGCNLTTTRKCIPHITRLPPILIMHLERFSFDGKKRSGFVDYPRHSFSMAEFANDDIPEEETIYDLTAVTVHVGGMASGHYYAYGLHPETQVWHLLNDSSTSTCSADDVLTKDAYLLFYQQRNQPPMNMEIQKRMTGDASIRQTPWRPLSSSYTSID